MINIYTWALNVVYFFWSRLGFSAVLWTVLLALLYYASTNFEVLKRNDALRNGYVQLRDRLGCIPPPFIGIIVWVVLRMIFAAGLEVQVELFLVLSSVTYVYRNIERTRQKMYCDLRNRLAGSKDPSTILGTHLPEWVTFPSAQRAQWLNGVLTSLWPSINAAANETLRPIIEDLLMQYKPRMVLGFKVRDANLGSNSIVVNGIQNHQYSTSETTLDISFSWNALMNICLLVRIPGPDMEVSIRDFFIRANLRVTLGPHIPTWPCFANMMVSILGSPEISFNIKAAKIPLDTVPGLGSFLDNFIRYTLVSALSFPKGFVYNVKPDYPLSLGFGSGALGVLTINLEKVRFAIKFLPYRKKKFYFKLGFLDSQKKRRKSAFYIGADSELTDYFHFVLYDTTSKIQISVYFDVTGSDIYVGSTELSVHEFINSKKSPIIERNLIRDSDAEKKVRGSLSLSTSFHALKRKTKVSAPPARPPKRSALGEEMKKMLEDGVAPAVPLLRGTEKVAEGGIIFISVESAANLPNKESFTVSDPYLLVRVGKEMKQSEVVRSNLNPVFNFETEMLVESISTAILKIDVIDKNVKKDELMSSIQFDLSRVYYSKTNSLAGDFDLFPQGTLRMSLSYLPFR